MRRSIWDAEIQAVMDAARVPVVKQVTVEGVRKEVPTPFASPPDWRDVWIYFLMVDRFCNPAAPPRHRWDGEHESFQGGTFHGVRRHLPYLKALGAGAIWLSPVLRNPRWSDRSYHGYGIQDFLGVEPRFASDGRAATAETELRALVDEAHALGLYVIFDVVLNHAGDLFNYEGMCRQRDWKPLGEYRIFWRDASGVAQGSWDDLAAAGEHPDVGIWPRELRRNEYFRRRGSHGGSPCETMGDFGALKELVTEYLRPDGSFPVREALIRSTQYLIARFDIDGYRIDTLKYVQPAFARVFGSAMREFALSIGKRDFFTFGEVWDREEKIARFIGRNVEEGDAAMGVDAALDFPVFEALQAVCKGRDAPRTLADVYENRKVVQRRIMSSHGDASRFFVTFLDNHDLNQRFYYQDPAAAHRYDDQLTMALGCLFCLQGIPCLYYGTEQGLHGIGSRREAVREALWGRPGPFDRGHSFYRAVQRLSRLRQSHPALRYGRQYFRDVSGNGRDFGPGTTRPGVLAFSRILNDREVVVVANTDTGRAQALHVTVDSRLHPAGRQLAVAYSNKPQPSAPAPVAHRDGRASTRVDLQPCEVQVLLRA